MTNLEFSDSFDTMVASFNEAASITFDEYEKSLFLTQAQEDFVLSIYSGRNPYTESFETTEEMREYLKPLISSTHKSIELLDNADSHVIRYGNCKTYRASKISDKIIGIVYEEVTYDDSSLGCNNGKTVPVIPVRHDEIGHIIKNPFRGPSKARVLRADITDQGIKEELISKYTLKQDSYYVRYLRKPRPIVLADLGDGVSIEGQSTAGNYDGKACELPEQTHNRILEMAVQRALRSKGYSLQQNENK